MTLLKKKEKVRMGYLLDLMNCFVYGWLGRRCNDGVWVMYLVDRGKGNVLFESKLVFDKMLKKESDFCMISFFINAR
ncbi:hypothetical protein, partial [Bacillus pumilus]|uniref:hypothetical protein n=1 Tax=Bacillus pumilus TaxID=1408 RepID=UPI001C92E736